MPLKDRQAKLLEIKDVINANTARIADVLVKEQGKTLEQATAEAGFAEAWLGHFATAELPVEVLVDTNEQRVEVHRKPLGVVVGIMAWNFPFLISVYKAAPALLAGNAIILKPAPTTPLSSLMLGELIADLVPPSLVQVLTGGDDLGPAMTSHPGIHKISFTGSTPTGKAIMSNASGTLKRLTLELGGNDAAIVLDDIDPKKVAASIFGAAFLNSGQVCISLKRLYVHESIYEEMCEELANLAKAAVAGDGADESSKFGSVQNKMQYEKVLDYMEDAKENGEIIAGGEIPAKPGYFVPITIVRDIEDGTRVVDEEPFGPILPVIKYSDVDDAVFRANNSIYALGGSVWSANEERAMQIAQLLESGTVWVNQHCAFGPHIPFPPGKQSGVGVEWGKEGLNELTAMQVVNINKVAA